MLQISVAKLEQFAKYEISLKELVAPCDFFQEPELKFEGPYDITKQDIMTAMRKLLGEDVTINAFLDRWFAGIADKGGSVFDAVGMQNALDADAELRSLYLELMDICFAHDDYCYYERKLADCLNEETIRLVKSSLV